LGLAADGNNDGGVNGADYDLWHAQSSQRSAWCNVIRHALRPEAQPWASAPRLIISRHALASGLTGSSLRALRVSIRFAVAQKSLLNPAAVCGTVDRVGHRAQLRPLQSSLITQIFEQLPREPPGQNVTSSKKQAVFGKRLVTSSEKQATFGNHPVTSSEIQGTFCLRLEKSSGKTTIPANHPLSSSKKQATF
jgi:hypothetical protein